VRIYNQKRTQLRKSVDSSPIANLSIDELCKMSPSLTSKSPIYHIFETDCSVFEKHPFSAIFNFFVDTALSVLKIF